MNNPSKNTAAFNTTSPPPQKENSVRTKSQLALSCDEHEHLIALSIHIFERVSARLPPNSSRRLWNALSNAMKFVPPFHAVLIYANRMESGQR
jgi:hypothetical protein